MKNLLRIAVLVTTLVFSACESEDSALFETNGSLKIVNWNVQTFFDSKNDGSEYSEFVKSKAWGKEMYVQRVDRLSKSIKSIDADIVCMEELENEDVLHDLANFLSGEWNSSKLYKYACFAKEDGSSIGCGILSRVPLVDMKIHSLDVRNEESMPKLRPMIEVTAQTPKGSLVILLNHWKSKSGGEETTEKWRNREEGILSAAVSRLVEDGKAVIALGDFNRDINEFTIKEEDVVVMRKWQDGNLAESGVEVKTPWFSNGIPIEPGSYYYKNQWSRIDNMFSAGTARIVSFYPETDGPWCNEENFVPIRYNLWNGEGYSDHLPIFAIVKF